MQTTGKERDASREYSDGFKHSRFVVKLYDYGGCEKVTALGDNARGDIQTMPAARIFRLIDIRINTPNTLFYVSEIELVANNENSSWPRSSN